MLPEPSPEQLEIIDKLSTGNCVVDSVAGSGKTTTNLHIARHFAGGPLRLAEGQLHFAEWNILLLTYNAKLKSETRDKVRQLGLDNLEVHSYHSFVVNYYSREAHTDTGIRQVLRGEMSPVKPFSYDLVICDEAQDLTPLYFEIVCKLLADNGKTRGDVRICVVGDQNQSIYQFNGADERMITHAPQIFPNPLGAPWHLCHLSRSFRVTHEVAEFTNQCLLGQCRMTSQKITGSRPRYLICDAFGHGKGFGTGDRPYREVQYYLDQGYSYSDFFIVAPSVRSQKSPVRQLANRLSEQGVPVFVPFSDEERLDEDSVAGKIVFSTFHQVKGLERRVVLVFGFDASYFEFYKQDQDPTICPNEIYVAVTRSLERLSVFHHYVNDYLMFLNRGLLNATCEVIEDKRIKLQSRGRSRNIATGVPDLVRHLPSNILDEASEMFQVVNIRRAGKTLEIPTRVQQKFGSENVSDINATAIPAYFEYQLKGRMAIYQPSKIDYARQGDKGGTNQAPAQCLLDFGGPGQQERNRTSKAGESGLKRYADGMPDKVTTPELLELANHWNAHTSGYTFKTRQIARYEWLSDSELGQSCDRLGSLGISQTARFEQRFKVENRKELSNRKLTGYIDCIDGENVYEFRCVSNITVEHYLQLALYAYLHGESQLEPERYQYFIYNVTTDQLDQILFESSRLAEMVAFLIKYKYYAKSKSTDRQFVNNLTTIRERYTGGTLGDTVTKRRSLCR